METLVQTLAVVATMADAVVYGTDVFSAIVQRPALAHVDDAVLTSTMGRSTVSGTAGCPSRASSACSPRWPRPSRPGSAAAWTAAAAAAVAAAALVVWLAVYNKVSAPVNKELTDAALDRRTAPNARGLQRTWDSVINARVVLQAVALGAMCVALVAS